MSRLLKILGLFCKRALWKRRYSAKVAYNFKEPTNRSHPIVVYDSKYTCGYIDVWLSCICTQVTCVTLRCTYEWVIYVTCVCFTRAMMQVTHIIYVTYTTCHIYDVCDLHHRTSYVWHIWLVWLVTHIYDSVWLTYMTKCDSHIWLSVTHIYD